MKKRRDLFDKLSGVSDEELEDKDYKRYKRSYYCYILVSSVVALLLGLLYGRLMETLALLQRFLSYRKKQLRAGLLQLDVGARREAAGNETLAAHGLQKDFRLDRIAAGK